MCLFVVCSHRNYTDDNMNRARSHAVHTSVTFENDCLDGWLCFKWNRSEVNVLLCLSVFVGFSLACSMERFADVVNISCLAQICRIIAILCKHSFPSITSRLPTSNVSTVFILFGGSRSLVWVWNTYDCSAGRLESRVRFGIRLRTNVCSSISRWTSVLIEYSCHKLICYWDLKSAFTIRLY